MKNTQDELAPIVLFAYTRIKTLKQVISALQSNFLATQSKLFVYVDGPKTDDKISEVKIVQDFVLSISGFSSVEYKFNTINKGLDQSVIDGVTEIVNRYGKVIVIEDDIVTTRNFLNYMNQALNYYENQNNIISICGFGFKFKKPINYVNDVYLFKRGASWGWATWKNQWDTIDWEVKDWNDFKKDRKAIREFKKTGSDMFTLLKNSVEGGNMWDVKFCYSQFKQNKFTIYPFLSKVQNVGFGKDAEHCKQNFLRFKSEMDTTELTNFNFDLNLLPNRQIEKAIAFNVSFLLRFYSKIRVALNI